jgi:hypothetical protein
MSEAHETKQAKRVERNVKKEVTAETKARGSAATTPASGQEYEQMQIKASRAKIDYGLSTGITAAAVSSSTDGGFSTASPKLHIWREHVERLRETSELFDTRTWSVSFSRLLQATWEAAHISQSMTQFHEESGPINSKSSSGDSGRQRQGQGKGNKQDSKESIINASGEDELSRIRRSGNDRQRIGKKGDGKGGANGDSNGGKLFHVFSVGRPEEIQSGLNNEDSKERYSQKGGRSNENSGVIDVGGGSSVMTDRRKHSNNYRNTSLKSRRRRKPRLRTSQVGLESSLMAPTHDAAAEATRQLREKHRDRYEAIDDAIWEVKTVALSASSSSPLPLLGEGEQGEISLSRIIQDTSSTSDVTDTLLEGSRLNPTSQRRVSSSSPTKEANSQTPQQTARTSTSNTADSNPPFNDNDRPTATSASASTSTSTKKKSSTSNTAKNKRKPTDSASAATKGVYQKKKTFHFTVNKQATSSRQQEADEDDYEVENNLNNLPPLPDDLFDGKLIMLNIGRYSTYHDTSCEHVQLSTKLIVCMYIEL